MLNHLWVIVWYFRLRCRHQISIKARSKMFVILSYLCDLSVHPRINTANDVILRGRRLTSTTGLPSCDRGKLLRERGSQHWLTDGPARTIPVPTTDWKDQRPRNFWPFVTENHTGLSLQMDTNGYSIKHGSRFPSTVSRSRQYTNLH